jgi:hypothetical protein
MYAGRGALKAKEKADQQKAKQGSEMMKQKA